MESGPVLAIVLTVVVHMVGIALLCAMLGRDVLELFRSSPPRDWGDGGEPPSDEPVAGPDPGTGGLPLPDAEQAPVRLREPGRIGEGRPRRRREHEPQPARQPERV